MRAISLLALAVFGGALLYVKWDWYATYSYTSDVFSYNRALVNTLRGKFMWDPTHAYLFGNHAYLILLLALPLYLVSSSPLILIQSSVFAHIIAACFVSKIAARSFPSSHTSLVVGAAYLFNPFLIEQVLLPVYGFQPDILMAPLFFGALYYYQEGRFRPCAFNIALLAAVKEEFALLSFGIVGIIVADRIYHRFAPRLAFFAANREQLGPGRIGCLGIISILSIAISFGVLMHAKRVTEFSFAPSLSGTEVAESFTRAGVADAWTHLQFYMRSTAYLSTLCPELLAVSLLRVLVNFRVYQPHTPEVMSMGAGWAWGNVAVINLLVLGLLVGLRRARELFRAPQSLLIALSGMIVLWSIAAVASTTVLGFQSGLRNWIESYETRRTYAAVLDRSLRHATPKLRQVLGPDEIVLISGKLFTRFARFNSVVYGFSRIYNRTLYEKAVAAVILREETEALQQLQGDSNFESVFEDNTLQVFVRQNTKASFENRTRGSSGSLASAEDKKRSDKNAEDRNFGLGRIDESD